MRLRRFRLLAAAMLLLMPVAAWGHGIIVNVDLNAAGTKLVTDLSVYADRDITAVTNINESLGYEQDDDVPGFDFSGNVLAQGGVISLKVIGPTYFWNPTSQLQATTTGSIVLDSLFYYAPPAGGAGPWANRPPDRPRSPARGRSLSTTRACRRARITITPPTI